MSDQHEPIRLRDAHSGANPMLKQLLQSAARATPSPARKHVLDDAILKRIEAQRERGDASAPNQAAPGWFGSRRNTAKLLIVLGLASSVGVAVSLQRGGSMQSLNVPAPALSPPTAAESSTVSGSPERALPAATSGDGPELRASDAKAPAELDIAPKAPASKRAVEPRVTKHARPASRSAHSPAARDTAATNVAPEPQESSSSPEQTSVPPELELLASAQRALRDDPEEALELTQLHARAYPTGAFVEEREAIAIEALMATGKATQAQARGRAFLSRHKNSAYAGRVARLLQASP